MIAFGGFQLGARRRGGAGGRGAAARSGDGVRRARCVRRARAPPRHAGARDPFPRRDVRLSDGGERRCSTAFRSHDSRRIVARDRRPERRRQDHAGQAAVPALRSAGGRDRNRRRRPARARSRRRGARGSRRCSRISSASNCRCATTSRPAARRTMSMRAALEAAGAANLAGLDTVLARGYDGGTDLSGGQWQRVALARALCAVKLGAGVVLLDEPTAQLDVRGEAEIFERMLAATRTLHDDPDLAPLLHRAPCRSHLRARARPRGRARHARRADGARRPLPDDVRSAGAALRRATDGRGGQRYDVLA